MDEGVMVMWFYIATAAISGCALTIVLCRRYVLMAFNSIDMVLERILSKDVSLPGEMTGEDRISKLKHKANRILDMCVSELKQTKDEKETIQGFISDMSHQMKTPLSGISMYADLLLEGSLSTEEQHEFLFRIKSGTDKLQWMMDSLIKMSRLEVGAIQLAPSSTRIRQTISDAISSVLAAASRKNINITVSDFEDMPLYHDRKWTCEAIANVLENAVKYSMPDGVIEVSVEPLPLHTKIIITDYGIGIEKDDWNMVFKRFYRGQNAKDNEGAGLGLYLAALIMEKQNGYIMVDSIPGQFTSFSLFMQNCQK
jgi:signal transduction histidine kinase